jgi:hypothetical protein
MGIKSINKDLGEAIQIVSEAYVAASGARVKSEELPAPYQTRIDAKSAATEQIQVISGGVAKAAARLMLLKETLQNGEQASSDTRILLDQALGRAGTAHFDVGRSFAPAAAALGEDHARAILNPALQAAEQPWESIHTAYDHALVVEGGFTRTHAAVDRIIRLASILQDELERCGIDIQGIGIRGNVTNIDPTYPATIIEQTNTADKEIGAAADQLERRRVDNI